MSAPVNCCKSNNVDKTNEIYVLNDSGRFAYHQWNNVCMTDEMIEAQKPVHRSLLPPEPKKRSKTARNYARGGKAKSNENVEGN